MKLFKRKRWAEPQAQLTAIHTMALHAFLAIAEKNAEPSDRPPPPDPGRKGFA